MAYVHQEYPKMKYHPTEDPKIVNSKEEDKALPQGWQNRPCVSQKSAEEESEGQPEDNKGDGEAKQPKPMFERAKGMIRRRQEK